MDNPGSVSADPDVELLARLRAGEPESFRILVETHGGRMRATALRLLRNAEDADDAVQDAFLSAFRALGRFESRSKLSTWLHRIVVNAALMKIRTRDPETEVDIDELLPEFAPSGAFARDQLAWEDAPDEPSLRDELHERVREGIDRLPEKYRIPLLLRDIEGLSNEEVARRLGVNRNACKIRVHRARQALRKLIQPWFASVEA